MQPLHKNTTTVSRFPDKCTLNNAGGTLFMNHATKVQNSQKRIKTIRSNRDISF